MYFFRTADYSNKIKYWFVGDVLSGLTKRRPRQIKAKEEDVKPEPVKGDEDHGDDMEMETSEEQSSVG